MLKLICLSLESVAICGCEGGHQERHPEGVGDPRERD